MSGPKVFIDEPRPWLLLVYKAMVYKVRQQIRS